MIKPFVPSFTTVLLALAVICVASAPAYAQATIVLQNNDAANVGFNDPTPATPVGGNNGTTVGEQRLIAFQFATNIWGQTLTSGPAITVRATWEEFTTCTANSGSLASAGAFSVARDFPSAIPGTWYGTSLANALRGTDPNNNPEIRARFNVKIGTSGCLETLHWYYGLDTSHISGRVNFVTVVLHELSHGLGFQTFTNREDGLLFGDDSSGRFPTVYDRFLLDITTGKTWPQMTNEERVASAINTGGLVWNGPRVISDAAQVLSFGKDSSGRPFMFTPSPLATGSSVTHWDRDATPNQLMEPNISSNLTHSVTPPQDLTFSLMVDIGWCANCPPPTQWSPTVLDASQVELKSWKVDGRTYVYAKLTFPDAGFRVSNWGTATLAGNAFSADATVERFNGTSVQAISSTAQIWDLGVLDPGDYTFAFKNSGTTVKTLNFTVSSTPPPPNPIDEAREFVRWQYKDFLRREPDGPGWDHWTGEITECSDETKRLPGETEAQCVDRKRENTSAAFFLSPEFQDTGYFVLRVYRGSLGRMPYFGGSNPADPVKDEFTRDAVTVSQGIVVNNALDPDVMNANKQAFVNEFVTRAEFRAIYDVLGNTQYVDKLFQTTGVTPTAADRQALIDGLNRGETRASVLFKVVDGTTTIADGHLIFNTTYGKAFYDSLFNAAFVQMEYFGYLLRDPDPDGYAFWLGKLNHFGDWRKAEMVRAFIVSPEYRARFGAP